MRTGSNFSSVTLGLWQALGGGKKMALERISLHFQEEAHTLLEHIVTSHAHTTGPEAVLCKPDAHEVAIAKVQVCFHEMVPHSMELRFRVCEQVWDR